MREFFDQIAQLSGRRDDRVPLLVQSSDERIDQIRGRNLGFGFAEQPGEGAVDRVPGPVFVRVNGDTSI